MSALGDDDVVGEVVFGPSVATLGSGETATEYPGFSMGFAFNFHMLHYGFGTLGLTIPITATIGPRPEKQGADFQRVHIPIGVQMCLGDASGFEGSGAIGGSVALGYGAMIGAFTSGSIDTRPFMSADISIGIFKRGALKLRYTAVIGRYEFQGQPVNYHGLFLVGSSSW